MPKLFCDERHERVQHDEDLVERPSGNRAGFLCRSFACTFGKNGLDQLKIPVAETRPCELVNRVRRCIEAQIGHRFVELFNRLLNFADDPLVRRELGFWSGKGRRCPNAIRLAKTRCIPELCREVAIALDPLLIHLDVAALAFHRRHEEAQSIRAILVNQAQRIDDIAFRLGHFRAVRRAHQPVQIEPRPRGLIRIVVARHHHPRVPEEQDVKAGNQQVIGIVFCEQVSPLPWWERVG